MANPPQLVFELIDHTSATWNMERVEEVFIPIDVQVILSIPLCTRNINDCWVWNFEKNGKLSVRSAYQMMVATKFRREAWIDGTTGSSSSGQEEASWKSLWNTQVPDKIRMFLWRLVRYHCQRRMFAVTGRCQQQVFADCVGWRTPGDIL